MSAARKLPEAMVPAHEGQIAMQLRYAQRHISHLLSEPGVTDLHINGAAADGRTAVFVKKNGVRERRVVDLTALQLEQMGANAAVLGGGQITPRMPFSGGKMADGQRAQIATPPAVPDGRYAMSIRCGFKSNPTPDQLEAWGVFGETEPSETAKPRAGTKELLALKAGRKWRRMIGMFYKLGYSGAFVGPVNTGKTTNLLSFFHDVDRTRRVLTVQDNNELETLPQQDVVHFIYPKDTGGVAQHTSENCIEACLRMDMDEIVNGEIRDGAAWAMMRAANSGHSFKTSFHAPSAEGAFWSLLCMAKQHPVARSFGTDVLLQTFYQLVDFIVFSELIDDKRRVTQIWFDPSVKKGIPREARESLTVEAD